MYTKNITEGGAYDETACACKINLGLDVTGKERMVTMKSAW